MPIIESNPAVFKLIKLTEEYQALYDMAYTDGHIHTANAYCKVIHDLQAIIERLK